VRLLEQLERPPRVSLIERELRELVQALDDTERIAELTADGQRRLERFPRLADPPVIAPNQADVVQAERDGATVPDLLAHLERFAHFVERRPVFPAHPEELSDVVATARD